jgi:ATP-dependent DNA ligase
MKEGDFVVSEVALGKAGKHAKVYARFKLGQYKDGELLDCGWAGPGTLSHDQLAEYTRDINSKKLKLPFVVEVEFRDWQEDSYCLEHPVIQRIRFDKEPKECEYEG